MSKVDVRVLRDLSESKKRVMTNVVQHLQQRHEKNLLNVGHMAFWL